MGERIGLKFNSNDMDIASWIEMLKENNIKQSFAIKTLLEAFFLNEPINGGTIKIRNNINIFSTSVFINEAGLIDNILKVKSDGIKLASFTKDVIRAHINCSIEDIPPSYERLWYIHKKFKMKCLYKYAEVFYERDKNDKCIIPQIESIKNIDSFNNINIPPLKEKPVSIKKPNPLLNKI